MLYSASSPNLTSHEQIISLLFIGHHNPNIPQTTHQSAISAADTTTRPTPLLFPSFHVPLPSMGHMPGIMDLIHLDYPKSWISMLCKNRKFDMHGKSTLFIFILVRTRITLSKALNSDAVYNITPSSCGNNITASPCSPQLDGP